MEKEIKETETSNDVSDKPNNGDKPEKEDITDQISENENHNLEKKLAEAYGKHDDIQNKYLRVHADLENIKKRSIREREDAVLRTRSQLITDILPVLDAFQMGINEASKEEEEMTYIEGFKMAVKQLESVLGEYGLVLIDPKEESFDPKFHEAIGFEEDNEYEMDIVIKTVRNGYRLGDKLLRPASVIVNKTKES